MYHMKNIVSLRQFAKACRMSTGALRFYIKKGVIQPKERVVKGYDLEDYAKIAEYRLKRKGLDKP